MKKFKKFLQNNSNVKVANNNQNNQEYIIEGTLRLQDNLVEAKSRYGIRFKGKIINTKYFNDSEDIPTLVCAKDESLVLGKPRFPENFKDSEYDINIVSNTMKLLNIVIVPARNFNINKLLPPKTAEEASARILLEGLMQHIKADHCKVCGDTEKDGILLKIPTDKGDIFLCDFCYNVQSNM
jgi:hypothetical protein